MPRSFPALIALLVLLAVPVALAGSNGALPAAEAGPEPIADRSSAPGQLTLVASAAGRGEVKDCGCPQLPRGGLARRAWYLDSLRTRYGDLLLVDAGDYTHPRVLRPGGINGFVLGALGDLGYDAMTLGELELNRGAEFVQGILDSARVPVVLANVRFQATDKPVGRPFVVAEAGGRRCAVTGVAGADLLDPRLTAFTVSDPVAALEKLLPEMRRQADLTVVLAHLSAPAAMALAEAVPGIDVVVEGHDPGNVPPTGAGSAVTVRTGEDGQFMGEVHLDLATGGGVKGFTGDVVMLDLATIPEQPAMARQVADLLHALGMAP